MKKHAIPNEEAEALIAEIHEAFKHVTREFAVSWNETVAIDHYASQEERLAARATDTDTHWMQLVDDKNWSPFPGIGGFCFIDAKGFHYYLPPTMIRFLRGKLQEWFPGHLAKDMTRLIDLQDSMWTKRQLRCIAWFISYMSRVHPGFPDTYGEFEESREAWRILYERGWRKRFEGPHPPYPRTP